jgi:type IV pilus assembly protein PilA
MSSKIKKSSKGFTIVELLIVIVVIGILAALVLNSFRGVQERARDTKRRTDVNAQASRQQHGQHSNADQRPIWLHTVTR